MPEEKKDTKNRKRSTSMLRVLLEVGFILFLFYSNLLMGEFSHSGLGQSKGLLGALQDIFTLSNFIIGAALAMIGHLVFEFLIKKL